MTRVVLWSITWNWKKKCDAAANTNFVKRRLKKRKTKWFCATNRRENKMKSISKELPMEFAVEAQKLLGVSLEGSVG